MTTKIQYENIQQATLNVIDSPKITAITYPGDDTAADTAGGQTITITGSNFLAGASVIINGAAVGVVSVVSANSITFTSPAQSSGSYPLYVVNTNGGTAVAIPGIQYSGTPTWTTAAGSLGSYTETQAIANTVTATGDAPITYSLYSGTLPTGATLNTSNGYISGTSPLEASPTTFTFTIRATDAQQQDTDRQFSLTINPDVVTWSSPANGTSYTSNVNSAISNVTMSASAASGQTITYTANALPTGLSISGSNITGTPTVIANSSSLLTATAATTNATATRTISWVIQAGVDTYWSYVSLLLSANTPSSTFVADASTNNFAITVNGDTKPNNLNPYTPGYYSYFFDGSGDYITMPDNASWVLGDNFTIECWVYFSSVSGIQQFLSQRVDPSTCWQFLYNWPSSGNLTFKFADSNVAINRDWSPAAGQWYHIAVCRNSSTWYLFSNGVQLGATATNSTTFPDIAAVVNIGQIPGGEYFNGYMSNLRVVKSSLYIANFTPSTTPLTAVANTQLLTCQSNRFIDNSTNNWTFTVYGDTKISSFIPFTPNSSYSTYGSGYFSGSGSLTAASNTAFSLTGDFTIECWVYLTTATGTKTIYTNRTSGANASGLAWVTQSGSQAMSIYTAGGFSLTSSISITLNAWTHVALTRSGSTMTQWVNGASGGTVTNSSSFTDAQCYIGVNNSGGEYWPGYITDFRIVKGTAVYTTAFTPPSSPLTAIANTSLLTLQNNQTITNNTFIDNSTNNYLITRNGNPTSGTFSPYAGGYSVNFNGSRYLSLAYNTNLTQWWTTDYTLEAWIFPTDSTSWSKNVGGGGMPCPTFIGNFNTTSASIDNYWSFGFDSSNYVKLYYYNGSQTALTSTLTVNINQWNHIAFTKTSSGVAFFCNGVGQAAQAISGTPQSSASYALNIGQYNGTGVNGYASNIRIVKGTAIYTGTSYVVPTAPLTPVTNTQALIAQSNRFIDNSINNATVSLSGSPTIQKFSPFDMQTATVPTSYSGYFDGSGDYLSIPDSTSLDAFSGDFTIEFWVYYTTTSGTQATLSKGWDSGSNFSPYLFLISSGNLVFYASSSAGSSWDICSATPIVNSILVSTWYHIAVSRSGSSLRFFANGSLVTTVTTSATFMDSSSACTIGSAGAGYAPMTGYVSNVRIVKGTAVYTSAFTSPTSPLTAIANTSLLTLQSTTFIDNSTNNFTITAYGNSQPTIQNPFGYTNPSAAAYTVSSLGGSMYFDGSGDYLTLPAAPMNLTSTTWTIEYWIYPTVISSSTYYALWAIQGSSSGLTQAIYGDSGTHYLTVLNNNLGVGTMNLAAINKVIVLNQWHHIALVNNGTTIQQYCNGIALGNASAASYSSTTPLIGSWGAGNYYNGYMSDFRVFKGTAKYNSNFVPPAAPMTALQNTTLLLNGTSAGIYDSSMNNDMETVGDTKISTAVKKYGNASIYFDGTGDYLDTPSNNSFTFGTADFTIELWLNTSSTGFNIMNPATATGAGYWGLLVQTSNLRWNSAYAVTNLWLVDATSILNGQWNHVAICRAAGVTKAFFNGTVVATNADTTDYSGVAAWRIGSGNVAGLNGYIDDLRITKGYARYTSNFTAPTTPFLQY